MINVSTQDWIGILEKAVNSREPAWFKKSDPQDIVSDGVKYSVISQSQLSSANQKGSFSKVRLSEIAAITAQKYIDLVQSNIQKQITDQEFTDQALKLSTYTDKLVKRRNDKIDIHYSVSWQLKLGVAHLINKLSLSLFNLNVSWAKKIITANDEYPQESATISSQLSHIRNWQYAYDRILDRHQRREEFLQCHGRYPTDDELDDNSYSGQYY